MNISFKFLTLFFLIATNLFVNCTDTKNIGEKIKAHLNSAQIHLVEYMETFESYLTKLHMFLKDDLELSYPNDILVFLALGIVTYYLTSLFNHKQNFVYNQPDQPDYSGLLNTKIKELTNLIKSANKQEKSNLKDIIETKVLSPSTKQFYDKINERLDNLKNSIDLVEKDFNINSNNLKEYLPIITNSQEGILSCLQTETPNGKI